MEITFDERKRRSNITKHGFDFDELDVAFFEAAAVVPAKHDRLMAVGRFDTTVVTVIFKLMGREGLSVVSMRIASSKERLFL